MKVIKEDFLDNVMELAKDASGEIDIHSLTKNQLWNLRNEIVLGSYYAKDYKNSYGIPERVLQSFFEGYLQYVYTLISVDRLDVDDVEVIEQTINPDTLYDFYKEIGYDYFEDLTSPIYPEVEENLKEDFLDTVDKLAKQAEIQPANISYKLKPGEYDHSKSFYGKAYVKTDDKGVPTLYSYNTPVVSIVDGKIKLLPDWNYGRTTLRHVKEFLAQRGFGVLSINDLRKIAAELGE